MQNNHWHILALSFVCLFVVSRLENILITYIRHHAGEEMQKLFLGQGESFIVPDLRDRTLGFVFNNAFKVTHNNLEDI